MPETHEHPAGAAAPPATLAELDDEFRRLLAELAAFDAEETRAKGFDWECRQRRVGELWSRIGEAAGRCAYAGAQASDFLLAKLLVSAAIEASLAANDSERELRRLREQAERAGLAPTL